jgi:L-lactate dehydrogenase complex protein LldE
VLTAGDMSCLMHIGGGLSRQRSGVRVLHLAEILASTREAPTPLPPGTFARAGASVR